MMSVPTVLESKVRWASLIFSRTKDLVTLGTISSLDTFSMRSLRMSSFSERQSVGQMKLFQANNQNYVRSTRPCCDPPSNHDCSKMKLMLAPFKNSKCESGGSSYFSTTTRGSG